MCEMKARALSNRAEQQNFLWKSQSEGRFEEKERKWITAMPCEDKIKIHFCHSFSFYFSTFFTPNPPPFAQLKHVFSCGNFSPFLTKSSPSMLCLWTWRRTQDEEHREIKNPSCLWREVWGELSTVLKWFSTVAAAEGRLCGRLGLITTLCREYRP